MWFLNPDADISGLVALCSLTSKGEIEKFCRTLVIDQSDFASFVTQARAGVFEPAYKYACSFRDRQPPHLVPTDEERAALGSNDVGPLEGKAKKLVVKLSQMLRDRRHLSAHIIFTPDGAHWSLFYFDQRDVEARDNHWEHGAHLHLLSSEWVRLDAATVFER